MIVARVSGPLADEALGYAAAKSDPARRPSNVLSLDRTSHIEFRSGREASLISEKRASRVLEHVKTVTVAEWPHGEGC